MKMKSSRGFVVITAVLFSCCVHAKANFWAADALSPVAEDIPYRAAHFYQRSGEYEKALMVLSSADRASAPAAVNAYRDMMAGYINVLLKRYEDAERSLSGLSDPQLFSDYNSQVLYPLVRAYYGQNRCDKALGTIARAQGFHQDISGRMMHIRVACMLQSKDPVVISQAEAVINDALMTKTTVDNMWFAYAYYNLASAAAGQFAFYVDADRFFNDSLKYTDNSAEGMALKERALLNLGFANYADNRFDYAAKAFAELPLESVWADVALLAYGWASLNSYKTDIAIESWRQLVNLPYKSTAVYEGYMAIPQAYEKATSYAEALAAYDRAIAEFIKMTNDIDGLLKTLSRQKIHEYAIQYSSANDQTEKNLPGMLARTYTEDSLRGLVEMVNEIEAYKKRIAEYDATLQQLQAKSGNGSAIPNLKVLQNNIVTLRQRSEKILAMVETQLLEQTVLVLNQQKKKIMQYTLDARVTNARLQEEFFQRGGRRLWR
jgi:hypothetical protein